MIPDSRVRSLNDRPLRESRPFVLYWMVSARRVGWNWALQHAAEEAHRLDLPLVVFEPLRAGYPWASARFQRFVIEGMRDQRDALEGKGVTYYPYVEPEPGAGRGLLEALAERSALVVTDDFPAFFLPRMVAGAAERLDVRTVAVDSNGLLPMSVADRTFNTAYSFRRYLQGVLPDHLPELPAPDPLGIDGSSGGRGKGSGGRPSGGSAERLAGVLDPVLERWPAADLEHLLGDGLAGLPIDHSVEAIPGRGGRRAGLEALGEFLRSRLDRYGVDRNHPDRDGASGLSPWLHWGHVSAQEVFHGVVSREGWTPLRLSEKVDGRRSGWWGLDGSSESFLDELITWREIGFNMCHRQPADYDRYESLPDWARETLADHAGDPRAGYGLERLDAADTPDEIWNAAQRQLRRDGVIHNYLRMLWGKKILEWSPTPRAALDFMIELNNRYALDGRDPNSYSGIFWVLGRYDRGWPERPIFGKVRCMTSRSTRGKLELDDYLRTYAQ
jgi:deoxyribodipyrimidine photo-lyase